MFNKNCNSNSIRNSRKNQEERREFLNTPIKGRRIVKVMKVTYCEAEEDKPERMHLFCRVINPDGTYDPRPINTVFGCWKGVDPDKFQVLMDNLQAAASVNKPSGLKGKVFSAVLLPKERNGAWMKNQYLMSWFEAADAPERQVEQSN